MRKLIKQFWPNILVLLFALYSLNNQENELEQLKKTGLVEMAYVTGGSPSSRNSRAFVEYKFSYKGQYYKILQSIPDYNQGYYAKNFFVFFDSLNPENARIILSEKDIREFKKQLTDMNFISPRVHNFSLVKKTLLR
ncbi:MAG: hypothetical protein NXI00_09735 [Cytophagales bacterium]|nr:hypothetical protein [Cytophagales bacterium]